MAPRFKPWTSWSPVSCINHSTTGIPQNHMCLLHSSYKGLVSFVQKDDLEFLTFIVKFNLKSY